MNNQNPNQNQNTNPLANYLALMQQNYSNQSQQNALQQPMMPMGTNTASSIDPSTTANLIASQQHLQGALNPSQQPASSTVSQSGSGSGSGPLGSISSSLSSIWNGLCEAWAEKQAFGKTGLFPSAFSAAQHFAQSGKLNPDIGKAPKGSLIYFAPDASNQGYGHVAISDGKGNITGATYSGVKTIPLNQWIQGTQQKPLGYVVPG